VTANNADITALGVTGSYTAASKVYNGKRGRGALRCHRERRDRRRRGESHWWHWRLRNKNVGTNKP
jgi:hypothetical protein